MAGPAGFAIIGMDQVIPILVSLDEAWQKRPPRTAAASK